MAPALKDRNTFRISPPLLMRNAEPCRALRCSPGAQHPHIGGRRGGGSNGEGGGVNFSGAFVRNGCSVVVVVC